MSTTRAQLKEMINAFKGDGSQHLFYSNENDTKWRRDNNDDPIYITQSGMKMYNFKLVDKVIEPDCEHRQLSFIEDSALCGDCDKWLTLGDIELEWARMKGEIKGSKKVAEDKEMVNWYCVEHRLGGHTNDGCPICKERG